MSPVLGIHDFQPWEMVVKERHEYQQGRLHRMITLYGAGDCFASVDEVEQALDAAAGAVFAQYPARLSLRPGRSLPVHFCSWRREVHPAALAGAFTLELEALADWEEADAEQEQEAVVSGAGVVCTLTPSGTLRTPLRVRFTASGTVLLPRFSDGTRTILYSGLVGDGATLLLDAVTGKSWLNGQEVSNQISGEYLFVGPEPTPLTFDAEPDGSLDGSVVWVWRERWI